MIDRRKAMVGWLVYSAAKPFVKRALKSKARAMRPGTREESSAPNTPALVMALAALGGGGYLFWRLRNAGRNAGGDAGGNTEEPRES